MDQKLLLPGERLVLSKAANAVIRLDDFGLQRLSFDQLMPLVGFKDKEAIGGKLHLTNNRLVFQSHAINRVTGAFSIFLPTIQGMKDASSFLAKKLQVETRTRSFEFVVWGVPALITAIQSAKDNLSLPQVEQLRVAVAADQVQFGEAMQLVQQLNAQAGAITASAVSFPGIAKHPLTLLGIANLVELMKG